MKLPKPDITINELVNRMKSLGFELDSRTSLDDVHAWAYTLDDGAFESLEVSIDNIFDMSADIIKHLGGVK